jgi:hypothetical protein
MLASRYSVRALRAAPDRLRAWARHGVPARIWSRLALGARVNVRFVSLVVYVHADVPAAVWRAWDALDALDFLQDDTVAEYNAAMAALIENERRVLGSIESAWFRAQEVA